MTGERWTVSPVLRVRDVAAAVDHYRDRLGFTCEPGAIVDGGGAEGPIYAVVHRDGIAVHLGLADPASRVDPGVEPNALGAFLVVSDVDRLHAELVERGATITRPPVDEPYGMRDFAVRDLDGYNLTFGSPLAGGAPSP